MTLDPSVTFINSKTILSLKETSEVEVSLEAAGEGEARGASEGGVSLSTKGEEE